MFVKFVNVLGFITHPKRCGPTHSSVLSHSFTSIYIWIMIRASVASQLL
jgi:hypothetical protein